MQVMSTRNAANITNSNLECHDVKLQSIVAFL